jgi:hypothetical protein
METISVEAFDLEVPQCSHCGVSLLTRDQPEASLVVAPDGCVLHWFCAYPEGGPERGPRRLPSCPSSHEHLDVGW